jgi:hypothetical protein
MKDIYKVVCIDNKPGSFSDKVQSLTIDKVYETTDLLNRDICIINDLCNNVNYSAKRFIYLEEWRDRKINKILNG